MCPEASDAPPSVAAPSVSLPSHDSASLSVHVWYPSLREETRLWCDEPCDDAWERDLCSALAPSGRRPTVSGELMSIDPNIGVATAGL